jgi:dihydrofolate synthase/folylpolyglutamate synthase
MTGLRKPTIDTVEDVQNYILSFIAPATNRHARITFRKLLAELDHPEVATKAIHITGTNGKGSTTAMLYNGLRAAGFRTAAYMSPDVLDFRERWQVDGDLVSSDLLVEATRELASKTTHIDPADTDLTEFEVKTLLAFLIARRSDVDYHCIEVGIGGKFDATNVIPAPAAAIITSVGADHADVLGETIRDVAYHKVGIVKAGTGVVGIGRIVGEARDIILERAEHLSLPVVDAAELHPVTTAIPGQHMAANAALVLAVLGKILPENVDISKVRDAISHTILPGRMQTIPVDGKVLLFDGAHNAAAAELLASTIKQTYKGVRSVHAVVAHTGTHDGVAFANALAPALTSVIVTVIPDRGQESKFVVDTYLRAGVPVAIVEHPVDAVQHAMQGAAPGDIVIVTGSFYLAGVIRKYLPDTYSPAICTQLG